MCVLFIMALGILNGTESAVLVSSGHYGAAAFNAAVMLFCYGMAQIVNVRKSGK